MENGVKKIIINMKALGWIEHMGSNKTGRDRQCKRCTFTFCFVYEKKVLALRQQTRQWIKPDFLQAKNASSSNPSIVEAII